MNHRFVSLWGYGILLALLLAAPPSARATSLLFSDFGPNGGFSTTVGNVVGNVGAANFVTADQFTPSATADLTSITLALGRISGTGTSVNVMVDVDNGGKPGEKLASLAASVSAPFGTNTVTLDTTTGPLLQAGTPYWLVVSATGGEFGFNLNNIDAVGPHGTSINGGASFSVTNTVLGAFSVSGNAVAAVPEPSSLVLGLAFGVSLLGYGWRRKRAGETTTAAG